MAHLQLVNGSYRVRIVVPTALRAVIGPSAPMTPYPSLVADQVIPPARMVTLTTCELAHADAAIFRRLHCKLARSLVSLSDCTRVMRDIVLGVLCGATMGLFVAMVGDFF